MEKTAKLDRKDFRILYELDYNARIPLGKLAKKVGISPQLAKYRIDNLYANGVIRSSMAVIDVHRLGYYAYRMYLRLQNAVDKKGSIVEYFVEHPRTLWVASTSGRWDMEVVFLAKNPIQANNLLEEIKGKLGSHVKNYSISPAVVNHHFERTYLVAENETKGKNPLYGLEPPVVEPDATDLKILKLLSLNGRIKNQEIANMLGIGFNTVKERIGKMENTGLIQAYRIFIDLEKIGRTFYKALITAKKLNEKVEGKMLTFCEFEPAAVYLIKTFGEWNLELEAEVRDEGEFRELMERFGNMFQDVVQDYEILHVYREHKINYFPMADEVVAANEGAGRLKKASA